MPPRIVPGSTARTFPMAMACSPFLLGDIVLIMRWWPLGVPTYLVHGHVARTLFYEWGLAYVVLRPVRSVL